MTDNKRTNWSKYEAVKLEVLQLVKAKTFNVNLLDEVIQTISGISEDVHETLISVIESKTDFDKSLITEITSQSKELIIQLFDEVCFIKTLNQSTKEHIRKSKLITVEPVQNHQERTALYHIIQKTFHLSDKSAPSVIDAIQRQDQKGAKGYDYVIKGIDQRGNDVILGGFADISPTINSEIWYGMMMCIDDTVQNLGLGKMLMEGIAKDLSKQGVKYLDANVPIFKTNNLLNIQSLGGIVIELADRKRSIIEGSELSGSNRVDRFIIRWDLDKILDEYHVDEFDNSENTIVIEKTIQELGDINKNEMKNYPEQVTENTRAFKSKLLVNLESIFNREETFLLRVPLETGLEDLSLRESRKIQLAVKCIFDSIFEREKIKNGYKFGYIIDGCNLEENSLLYRVKWQQKQMDIPSHLRELKQNLKLHHFDSCAERDRNRNFYEKYCPLTARGLKKGKELDNILNTNTSLTLVSGNPGAGKSTFAKYLCHQVIDRYREENMGYIPVFVDLNRISLEQFEKAIDIYRHQDKILFIFDGFDEIEGYNNRIKIGERIMKLSQNKKCVVFGRRFIGLDNQNKTFQLKKYSIRSLDTNGIKTYVEKYYAVDKDYISSRTDNNIDSDIEKAQKAVLLIKNCLVGINDPILLEMFCFRVDTDSIVNENMSVVKLYQETLYDLIYREVEEKFSKQRPKEVQNNVEGVIKLLEFIAEKGITSRSQLKDFWQQSEDDMDNCLEYARPIIRDLRGELTFTHETFKEFFKASYYYKNPDAFMVEIQNEQINGVENYMFFYLVMCDKTKLTKEIVAYFGEIEVMCQYDSVFWDFHTKSYGGIYGAKPSLVNGIYDKKQQFPFLFKQLFHYWRDRIMIEQDNVENSFPDEIFCMVEYEDYFEYDNHFIFGKKEYLLHKNESIVEIFSMSELSFAVFEEKWINLQQLIVSEMGLGIEWIRIFASNGNNFPKLESLIAGSNNLNDQCIEVFIQNAHQFCELTHINFQDNDISEAGREFFKENISKFPKLKWENVII